MKLKEKAIFNQDTGKKHCGIVNGETDGIIDFVDPDYSWATEIWDRMEANSWFPQEANVGQDKIKFEKMNPEKKEVFELVLAQLIANDSIQTNQLIDKFNRYITSPVVNAVIAFQAMQEALHSKSYAVITEELLDVKKAREVYEKHKHNKALNKKNKAVEEMYNVIYKGDNPSVADLLVAAGANNVLEKLVFPAGFVTIWSMGDELVGSAKMISFIERDETLTHVPLFKNIYRTIVYEQFGSIDNVPNETKQAIYEMVDKMYIAEKEWLSYLSKNLLGFSERVIEQFIGHKANEVLKNCLLEPVYKDTEKGGILTKIEKQYSMASGNKKTNFFESKVGDYSIGSLNMNF